MWQRNLVECHLKGNMRLIKLNTPEKLPPLHADLNFEFISSQQYNNVQGYCHYLPSYGKQ